MYTFTTTPADRKAQQILRGMSTARLLDLWEETTTQDGLEIATVRGWLMDELESRNPDGFNAWMDAYLPDEDLRNYI